MRPVDLCNGVGGLAVVFAQLMLFSNAAVAQCYYTYTAIPAPNGWQNPPTAINNHGVVAGYLSGAGESYRAYVWNPETGMTVLPLPPGIISMIAADINDHGEVCGWMTGQGGDYAFVWNGTSYTVINRPAWATNFYVRGINNSGQVVGSVMNTLVGPAHAFRWQNGVLDDLGPSVTAFESYAEGVNEFGEIAGWGYQELDPPYDQRGFFVDDANATTWLPLHNGGGSNAFALNNTGITVGAILPYPPSHPEFRYLGAIWTSRELFVIEPPAGTRSALFTAVNDAGRAVGYYHQMPTPPWSKAIVWQTGELRELRPMVVPPPPTATVTQARDINESGQILVSPAGVLNPIWLPGDVTGDCAVSLDDLALVLANFGSPPGSFPRGDVDIDGDVDLTDLAVVLGHLGN